MAARRVQPAQRGDDLPLLLQRRLPRGVRAIRWSDRARRVPLACTRSPRSARAIWRRAASTAGPRYRRRRGRQTAARLQTAAASEVYHDVSTYVPADNQTVQVGQVMVVGHDEHQPAGSQDTFLLDDSTLAWGQINDPSASTQIRVTKTQPLPGFGPTDKGSYLVVLAGRQDFNSQPPSPSKPGWPMAVGYGGLGIAMGLVAWMDQSSERSADLTTSG